MQAKVKVISLPEPQTNVGEKKLTKYFCIADTEIDGKVYEYTFYTFSPTFGKLLKPGLECDFTYEEHEYKDKKERKITDIIINGESVQKEKKFTQYKDDSPEKKSSIEAMNSNSAIAVVLASPNAREYVTDDMIIGWQIYNRKKLGTCPEEIAPLPKDIEPLPKIIEPAESPYKFAKTDDWNEFTANFKKAGMVWSDVYRLLAVKNISDLKEKYKNPPTAFSMLLTKHGEEKHKK